MKLSDIPIDQIKPGLRVIGANGVFGTVKRVDPPDREDYIVIIHWDNEKDPNFDSMVWHFWCDNISIKE